MTEVIHYKRPVVNLRRLVVKLLVPEDKTKQLSDEMMCYIFSFLDSYVDRAACALVCRRWKRCVQDISTPLYSQVWVGKGPRRSKGWLGVKLPSPQTPAWLNVRAGAAAWSQSVRTVALAVWLIEGSTTGRLQAVAQLVEAFPHLHTLRLRLSEREFRARLFQSCVNVTELCVEGFYDVKDIRTLRHAPNLVELDLQDSMVADVSPLRECTRLRVLNLCGTAVRDLRGLEACSQLVNVGLAGTLVSSVDALQCSSLTLQQLNLHRTTVTDIGPLQACAGLSALNLCATRLTCNAVHVLRHCVRLVDLDMGNVDLSHVPEKERYASTLKRLNLSGSNVSDLSALASCSRLEVLDLSWNSNVSCVRAITPCMTSLRHLNLCGTAVGDVGFVAQCTALTYLNLRDTPVTCIKGLHGSNVSVLVLSGTDVSDLSVVPHCPNLTTIDLGWNTQVTDISVLSLCTHLTSVDLHGTHVSCVEPLSHLPALANLDLASTPVMSIDPLSSCRHLTRLKLRNTKIRTVAPLQNCTSLSTLDLSSTLVHSVKALRECTKLRELDLTYTAVASTKALAHCTGLTELRWSKRPPI